MYDDKANRRYYIDGGRCPVCGGKNPLGPGLKMCVECRQAQTQRNREKSERWREEGKCPRCGGDRDGEYILCKRCRDYRREKYGPRESARAKKRYNDLKEQGLCTTCGKTWAELGRTQCRKCLNKQREKDKRWDPNGEKKRAMRQARKEAGLCIDCGKPSDGHTRCKACNAMRLDSTRKYVIHQRTLKGEAK